MPRSAPSWASRLAASGPAAAGAWSSSAAIRQAQRSSTPKLAARQADAAVIGRRCWAWATIGSVGAMQIRALLQPRGPAAAVVLDDAQVAVVGEGAKRFPVVATVNGYTWRTSVTRMGGEFLLVLSREVRQGAGVEAGDLVDVAVRLDAAPRDVVVPDALA